MSKVLLLETDSILASNLEEFLARFNHELEWHVDPQLAVYSIDKNRPDVVIIDLMLASRSGVEFLYEFRSYPDWQELPLIVFSNVSERELGQCVSSLPHLNVSAYFYKPHTTLKQLVAAVNQLTQKVPA